MDTITNSKIRACWQQLSRKKKASLLSLLLLVAVAFGAWGIWHVAGGDEKMPADSHRLRMKDRTVYVGETEDGRPHGFGKLTTPDGYIYMGNWFHGEKTGRGSEWKSDGEKYIGQFKGGLRHGQGVVYYPDGSSYSGDLRANRLEGYGTRHYEANDKYVGYWRNDCRHGRGVLYRRGQIAYGVFEGGLFKQTLLPPQMNRVYGIDLSHYNEAVPWHDLSVHVDRQGVYHARRTDGYSAPLVFCYVKATEGADVRDEQFDDYYELARHAFYVRGAYHIFSSMSAAADQARNYIQTVRLLKGDLPPILDIEKTTAERMGRTALVRGVKQWLDLVERHYGVRPIIYVSDFVKRDYLDVPSLRSYHFIVARYVADASQMASTDWTIWQFSENGRIGIRRQPYQTDIDLNVYRGDFAQFSRFVEQVCVKK